MSIVYGSEQYAGAVAQLASQAGQAAQREKVAAFALQQAQLQTQRQQMQMNYTLAKEQQAMEWEIKKAQLASQADFARQEGKRQETLDSYETQVNELGKALSKGFISEKDYEKARREIVLKNLGANELVKDEYAKELLRLRGEQREAEQEAKQPDFDAARQEADRYLQETGNAAEYQRMLTQIGMREAGVAITPAVPKQTMSRLDAESDVAFLLLGTGRAREMSLGERLEESEIEANAIGIDREALIRERMGIIDAPGKIHQYPQVLNDDDLDKLPSGTEFRDPEGNIRIKP